MKNTPAHLFIGASLSEPHTRELGGEISVCMYACLLACLYPSDFARELEVKCSRGQVRITADSKSRSRRFDTADREMTCFFFFFFQASAAMYTHAHQLPVQVYCISGAAYCMRPAMDAVLQRLSKR